MSAEVRAADVVRATATFAGILLVIFLLGGCIVSCKNGLGSQYASGTRKGTLYRFSDKGWIRRHGEGSLLLNEFGMSSGKLGSSTTGNVWEFNTRTPELHDEIQKYMDSGEPVLIDYNEWFISPWYFTGSYEITGIRPIGSEDPQ